MVRSYDKIASRYERMHSRWLRHAGGEAQAALEACLISRVRAGDRVLDAGCGTGALSRALTRQGEDVTLTLLDVCDEMLAMTKDVPARRVRGSLLDMPFQSGTFDIAVAAWAIEATPDAPRAVAELMRVVRPGGRVLVAFCATEPPRRLAASLLRKGVEMRRTGRFLDAGAIEAALRANGADSVIRHRCTGPVAMIDARAAEPMPLRLAA